MVKYTNVMGCSQAVRHQTLTLAFRWFEPIHPSQKIQLLRVGFFYLFCRHNIICLQGQHHFERSENFIAACGTNE